MNKPKSRLLTAGMLLALAGAAWGQVSLNSVRVVAKDAETLGKFYSAAFGLKETNRLQIANGVEIFLNFGASAESARANTSPQVVIMQDPAGPGDDTTMHVIFTVADAASTARAVETAGGSIVREPAAFGNSGMMIGFVADPEGNRIELIQPASR